MNRWSDMDGWMDELIWMDGWVDGLIWIDGWINGWMDG